MNALGQFIKTNGYTHTLSLFGTNGHYSTLDQYGTTRSWTTNSFGVHYGDGRSIAFTNGQVLINGLAAPARAAVTFAALSAFEETNAVMPASDALNPVLPAEINPRPQPAVGADQTPPTVPLPNDLTILQSPALQPPKPTKNEVSVSGDAMLGQGTVTFPLGYSLNKSLGGIAPSIQGVFNVPRNSDYYGGTLSYSYGQSWYLDLSIAEGKTTGTKDIPMGFLGDLNSTFSIDDSWYQAYVKYAFPQLRGKRLSAYLRLGASYVDADLKDNSTAPALDRYTQTDTAKDILGNAGFGLGYSFYSSRHLRLDMQFEGEGFYGIRSQQSLETLSGVVGVNFVPANIDNTLYGGMGGPPCVLSIVWVARGCSRFLVKLELRAGKPWLHIRVLAPKTSCCGGHMQKSASVTRFKLNLRNSI